MAKRKPKPKLKPPPLTVVVTVEEAVVRDVEAPKGVRVIVRNYDVDLLADNLSVDERGRKFWATVWEAKP